MPVWIESLFKFLATLLGLIDRESVKQDGKNELLLKQEESLKKAVRDAKNIRGSKLDNDFLLSPDKRRR